MGDFKSHGLPRSVATATILEKYEIRIRNVDDDDDDDGCHRFQ